MDVTLAVCTFGDVNWEKRGEEKASQYANIDNVKEVVHVHERTLQRSRNHAIECAKTEYISFLDADDDLAQNYFSAMGNGTADILVPKVRYLRNQVLSAPMFPRVACCNHVNDCEPNCLPYGNYVVIGACAKIEKLKEINGFADWPIYEDWDLWLRMYIHGCSFQNIEDAIYIAHYHASSRNRLPNQRFKNLIHKQITQANKVDLR